MIIHLPQPTSRLVCLSATVSNAEELADWITTVRGPTDDRHRGAPAGRAREPLPRRRPDVRPTCTCCRRSSTAGRTREAEPARRGRGSRPAAARPRAGAGGGCYTPRRVEVVERLDDERMLPAIYFIFSRAACDDAVEQCLDAGLRLTDRRRARRASARSSSATARARSTTTTSTCSATTAGSPGSRPASPPTTPGMVPPFKEAVEACFAAGLVKVVFATETLALGINMPARSVVIEKLSKFTGEHHEFLTPGEYTQLTGRAGRRGHRRRRLRRRAVVARSCRSTRSPALASSRTFRAHARRSGRPTTWPPTSCARYPPRRGPPPAQPVVRAVPGRPRRRAARGPPRAAQAAARRRCASRPAAPLGDIDEYRRCCGHGDERRPERRAGATASTASLARLKPGDVIMLDGGQARGRAAVLTVAQRRKGGVDRSASITPQPAARARSPSRRLRRAVPRRRPRSSCRRRSRPNRAVVSSARSPAQLRTGAAQARARAAPHDRRAGPRRRRPPTRSVSLTPSSTTALRAAAQAERVGREVRRPERAHRQSQPSRSRRRFDRVLRCSRRGATSTVGAHRGRRAARRAVPRVRPARRRGPRPGLLDDLDPAALAGARVVLHLRAPQPRGRRRRRGSRRPRCATGGAPSRRWPNELNADEDEARAALEPGRPTRRSSRWPTPGRRGRRSTTSSRTRTCPAATSCATSSSSSTCSASSPTCADGRHPGVARGGGGAALPRRGRRVVDRRDVGVRGDDDRTRRRLGRAGAAARRRRDRQVRRATPLRSSRCAARVAVESRRSGCSAATCAARSAGTGDERGCARSDAITLPSTSAWSRSTGAPHWFVAHLVARRSWWRGRVCGRDERRVARASGTSRPARHPNDGRSTSSTSRRRLRDRWKARRRLAHRHARAPPCDRAAPPRPRRVTFDSAFGVWIDGVRGRRRDARLAVRVDGRGRSTSSSLGSGRWTRGSSTSRPAPTAGGDRPDPEPRPDDVVRPRRRQRAQPHGPLGHAGHAEAAAAARPGLRRRRRRRRRRRAR